MTTEEIIGRLRNMLRDPRWPDLCTSAEDIYKDDKAMTAAIQAVELLEEIRQELHGECRACVHVRVKGTEEPCKSCSIIDSKWDFRWPLGEETDHEA